ncbi:WG repeat protein [Chitinophaga dinghuensis]|uniref:WG repeat protein n=1 Tax=Chitinophaga dinghuensis TaxID=1539050 RepID=A0A327VYC5_9BACT|nr:WG repeat-containing protein [Chitinophaga dinghuensis]RAJ80200.1 WG repeat protein [Chitinophaga dinghuensis]
MKVFSVLLLTVILFGCQHPTTVPLFPYQENGKSGYIDQQGNVVIAARFAAVQDFSEELAAVRTDGYYGYIDKAGKFMIDPTYDYATPFSQGIALVYKGSIARYIDKSGQTVTPVFLEGEVATNGTAIVTNFGGKKGLIDTTGKLILDTTYQQLSREEGGLMYATDAKGTFQLLDKKGQLLPFYNTYPTLFPWREKYILGILKSPDSSHNDRAVLDLSAKEIIRYNSAFVYPLDLSDDKIMLEKTFNYTRHETALYDLKSKDTLLNNVEDYTPFNNHWALVKNKDGNVMMVGSAGNLIPTSFKYFEKQGFQHGYAFVATDKGYGLIDTTGQFVINPQYNQIVPYGRTVNTFFFGKMDHSDYGLIGMANNSGQTIIPPVLQSIDKRGFVSGLMLCTKDNLSTYLDTSGKVVWQEKKGATLLPMNIDYVRDGDYYVKEEDGWGYIKFFRRIPPYKYYSVPKPFHQDNKDLTKSLLVRVDTAHQYTFDRQNKGYKVQILNNADTSISLPVQDFKLHMVLMAFLNNQWVPIEQFPVATCAHPTHTFNLKVGFFWELFCPQYVGAKQVRLRMALRYWISTDAAFGEVYSNEFSGSINPGQLWRSQENKLQYKVSIFQQ